MGNQLTVADLALVQAAVDEANGALARALAVIENTAERLERELGCPAWCQGEDFGDCPGCAAAYSYRGGDCPRDVVKPGGLLPIWPGDLSGKDNGFAVEPKGRVFGAGERRAQD